MPTPTAVKAKISVAEQKLIASIDIYLFVTVFLALFATAFVYLKHPKRSNYIAVGVIWFLSVYISAVIRAAAAKWISDFTGCGLILFYLVAIVVGLIACIARDEIRIRHMKCRGCGRQGEIKTKFCSSCGVEDPMATEQLIEEGKLEKEV